MRLPSLCTLAFAALALVSSAQAALLISNYNNDSVSLYSNDGIFLSVLVPSGSGGLDGASGLAIGPGGDLFVASRFTDEVLRYDGTSGAFLGVFVDGLDGPTDIEFGPGGDLYVASGFVPAFVQRHNGLTGAFIGNFTSGAIPDINSPLYIAFGPSELAVTTDTDRVFRFTGGSGVFISSAVRDTPQGVAYDAANNLYIASRISGNVVRDSGGTLTEFIAAGTGGLGVPRDLAFGPDGNLYVLTESNLLRFDGATGAFIDTFISDGGGRYMLFTTAIPEPGTIAMSLIGFGLLVGISRVRSRAAQKE